MSLCEGLETAWFSLKLSRELQHAASLGATHWKVWKVPLVGVEVGRVEGARPLTAGVQNGGSHIR